MNITQSSSAGADKKLPAEKPCKLMCMDVRHTHPLQHIPDFRILGHAGPFDRRKHQGLEPDGAVFPPEGSEQRGHHPVGCSVVGLTGIPLDRGRRGEAHEKPQTGPLRS